MSSLIATISAESSEVLEFAGMPGGWTRLLALATLLALLVWVVWLYRREARAGASARLRATLAIFRCCVLLTLAGVWLEPVIASYTKRVVPARVAVLIDASASMALADAQGADGSVGTRAEQVARLLSTEDLDAVRRALPRDSADAAALLADGRHAWLKRIAARNELDLYSFGDEVARLPLPWRPAASGPSSSTPTQGHTDLGRAVLRIGEEAGESPLAGVVIFTDGALNRGMSAEDVAAYARRFKAPVYTVGVGRAVSPPNVRVAQLSAPATVSKGDPLELRVELDSEELEEMSARLELRVQRPGEAPRIVGERAVTLGGQTPRAAETFTLSADDAGSLLYTAHVEPIVDEVVQLDNTRTASVLVLDDRLRVLMVAGRPSYDFRQVAALLIRDRTIDVSCWLQSAEPQAIRDGDVEIRELPRKPEDLLQYDAVLLMDPDPREFDASWALTCKKLVDELGGGVLFQAGSHYSTRFLRDERLTDLVAMLPITPDPESDLRLSAQGSYRTRASPLVIPDDVRAHPLLALHPDPVVNQAVLASLPGVWWSLPVLREKSLATVLLRQAGSAAERNQGAVLLATQPFGAGRTVFLAYDGTWRWRSNAQRYFERFWIQTVRYLAQARRQGGSRRGVIVVDRDVVNIGEYVKIEARVLDPLFQPWLEPGVDGVVELGDGATTPIRLALIPGREGWYAGRVALDREGSAMIRIPVPGGGSESIIKHVQVQPPDVELRSLKMQEEALRRIADATGGSFLTLAQAGALPDRILNASQATTIPGPRRALWDRSWVMMLVAVLLCVEWALRRRNHLL